MFVKQDPEVKRDILTRNGIVHVVEALWIDDIAGAQWL